MLARIGINTSYAVEWGWALGRFGVIVAATVAVARLMADSSAFGALLALLVFTSIYSFFLILLLARQNLRLVFGVGLFLDNATLLAGWWLFARSVAGSVQTNDAWLILIPLIIVGVVRLGWVIGSIYTGLWIGWMAWSFTYYYGPGSYDVQQLPLRVLMIVVIAGLVMRLVSLIARQRGQEMERLQELERLESMKSTLLRTVAHEVKSPITAVRAAADLIGDPNIDFDGDQRERGVATLHSGVRRLESIVQESLAYAVLRGDGIDLSRRPVDMREVVIHAVRAVEPAAQSKGQQVIVASPMLLASVDADAARIEQVLVNLLGNAVKFAPEGGEITVGVRETDGLVVTEISNSGAHIPKEEQERICEEYYQGGEPDRNDIGSFGLGLTVARRRAEAHGGSISVVSDPETLTMFTLSLPADGASAEGETAEGE